MAEPQNKSNTGIIIGAVVVIIIALGWYFYGGSSADAPVQPAVVETPTTDIAPAVEPDAPLSTDPAPAVEMPDESVAPDMDDTTPSAD